MVKLPTAAPFGSITKRYRLNCGSQLTSAARSHRRSRLRGSRRPQPPQTPLLTEAEVTSEAGHHIVSNDIDDGTVE